MQQTINGLALGSTYALLGVGVTLVWGVLNLLNFAHAQILTWGSFAALAALRLGVPVPVAILVGMVTAGALSVLIDLVVLAPLRGRKAPEFSFVVATIGVSLVLTTVLRTYTDAQTEAFPRQGFPVGAFEFAGQNVPRLQVVMLVIAVVAMAGLGYWLNRTKSGRAVRAVAYNRETAELLGVNSQLVFSICFFVAGALAAVAGIFVAASAAQVSYSSGDGLLLIAFAVIILGGMGSVKGAIIGGLVLGVIEVYATTYVSSVFREIIAFAVILAVLVARPSGFFGKKEAARV
ncbi:branched-chain amino acid ABC transporter permease [Streptosporangium amethystogenes subsp. fukuiense]|uniref:Branched-chain amino acid ABC transporter permease n=1 Tax=Streptosporangium amethystogenes subsp. fukuiense TaxID=698418 RepID=A0ABW2T5A8_9ACTN